MAAPEKPPDRPFHYTLDRRLAAGGMGEVYLARDKTTGKVCVIKRMLPNLMSDAQFVAMFLDEARLAAQLNHPNIAPLYDFGMGDGVLFLAMEYVPGANLRVIVKEHTARKASVPFDAAARILSQAALALDYAHGAKTVEGVPIKLIHRDVSPQNILLSTSGVVKLIDFGVAKAATSSQQTAAGLIKGKYAYMSPEQLRGQPLDGRSDIFGLGLVLYELLAGERAIPGKTDAEVAQNALSLRFAPIKQKRPDVPERLERIVNKALMKDVRERYQTAAEMSSDLERFLADRRVSPSTAELAKLLPAAGAAPPPLPPPPPPESVPWPTNVPTRSFWDNQAPDGLPTQQLTPSQLPVKSTVADASEAPTAFAKDLELPAAPVSQSQLQKAIRKSLLPWVISTTVLILGAAALIWGFLLLDRKPPPPAPVAVVKPPEPVPPPPPPAPAPVAAPAPSPPPAPQPATVSVASSIPARVSIDGAASARAPMELTLAPGAHTIVFEDLATGLKHKRALNLGPGDKKREVWNPERGKLVVRASPWAEIFVGDRSLGVTPMDAIDVIAGRHSFRFVNTDTQRTVQRVVDVAAGRETLVKVDLR